MNGKKMKAPVIFEKNNTGNTALFSSDFFREMSYMPKHTDEHIANTIHIFLMTQPCVAFVLF